MIIDVQSDNMGNITAVPRSDRIRRKFVAHLKDMGAGGDGTAFFQEGGAASAFLEDCSPKQRRDIDGGYRVSMRVDPWLFGMWLGWDAHHVVI